MKSVCFYFNIHQPFRLKRYRFFRRQATTTTIMMISQTTTSSPVSQEQSYMPMADTLLEMIRESNGTFKCAISISGTAIEQLQLYVPEFIDKLKTTGRYGMRGILAGTYAHSLSSLEDHDEFIREVKQLDRILLRLFGVKTKTFANTELIYDDDIAMLIAGMGFRNCLTAGAKHVLGWKSPNYVYKAATASNLRLLITNDKLAGDISMNFNRTEWDEYPPDRRQISGLDRLLPEQEQVVNMFLSMDTFGTFIPESTGIFEFMKALPRFAAVRGIRFSTPSEVCSQLKPVGELTIPYPLSDIDEARDVSAWKGNELQNEALSKLYSVAERVSLCDDRRLKTGLGIPPEQRPLLLHVHQEHVRTARRTRLSARTTRLSRRSLII